MGDIWQVSWRHCCELANDLTSHTVCPRHVSRHSFWARDSTSHIVVCLWSNSKPTLVLRITGTTKTTATFFTVTSWKRVCVRVTVSWRCEQSEWSIFILSIKHAILSYKSVYTIVLLLSLPTVNICPQFLPKSSAGVRMCNGIVTVLHAVVIAVPRHVVKSSFVARNGFHPACYFLSTGFCFYDNWTTTEQRNEAQFFCAAFT